jgi:2-C-methyl-D-erythritol 4-phosphate cytidylyltransferase/2-C-methyl-D-erythritol 2,4-cyclodiphosphate synthase
VKDITLIILSAGNSTRFGSPCKKQWLYIDDKPLWLSVADRLSQLYSFAKTIIVASKDDCENMRRYCEYEIIQGGSQRQYSLQNALEYVQTPFVLVTDIARACVPNTLIDSILQCKNKADVIVPYLPVSDTVVYGEQTIEREKVKLIQTPQLSKTAMLQKALQSETLFTDESSAIKQNGGLVHYVLGSPQAHKLTFTEDLSLLPCLCSPSSKTLSGIGYDIHSFEPGKQMKLCGVNIESAYGFKAHSDGDVAIHAIIDAMLGAAGLGDIGEHFPDTDNTYKGIDSAILLQKVASMIRSIGFEIESIDITILMQKPKLSPYKHLMKTTLAHLLELPQRFVNIKATTGEQLGYIGRGEGAAVQAICNLRYYDWSKT